MVNWTSIIMAGLGAGVAQIDPSLDTRTMVLLALKAFVGAACGAYFGNHVNQTRERRRRERAKTTPEG